MPSQRAHLCCTKQPGGTAVRQGRWESAAVGSTREGRDGERPHKEVHPPRLHHGAAERPSGGNEGALRPTLGGRGGERPQQEV